MDQQLINDVHTVSTEQAWQSIFAELWQVFSRPLQQGLADAQTVERDLSIKPLDDVLSGSAWDLWDSFDTSAPKTSEALKSFWQRTIDGKAILILDALSLRESPWLLEQAGQRGYTIHSATATASEIPGDTTPFAKALGYASRSALENGAGKSKQLPNAVTESTGLPFADCVAMIKVNPNIIFWHHWPDDSIHELAAEGDGYRRIAREAANKLTSDDFWHLLDKLVQGRRVVVTGDHGYANSALFPDINVQDQKEYLKSSFKNGRSAPVTSNPLPQHWSPPLAKTVTGVSGTYSLVLGRKKWKGQGGYPTLCHGGLSLLEVAVPFIELSKS
jgi:hypothetical protein